MQIFLFDRRRQTVVLNGLYLRIYIVLKSYQHKLFITIIIQLFLML